MSCLNLWIIFRPMHFNYKYFLHIVEDIETDIDVFSECLIYGQGDENRLKITLKGITDLCHINGMKYFNCSFLNLIW